MRYCASKGDDSPAAKTRIVEPDDFSQLQIDPEKAGGDVQTLKRKLDEKGVTNIPHFGPLYRFAAVKEMGLDQKEAAKSCPVCEDVFDRRFTHLPIYGLSDDQLKYMADAILEAVKEMQEGR